MLKFIKGHVASIAGIDIYPVISFLIFFLFFIGLLIFTYKISKEYVKTMGEMPLDTNDSSNDIQSLNC